METGTNPFPQKTTRKPAIHETAKLPVFQTFFRKIHSPRFIRPKTALILSNFGNLLIFLETYGYFKLKRPKSCDIGPEAEKSREKSLARQPNIFLKNEATWLMKTLQTGYPLTGRCGDFDNMIKSGLCRNPRKARQGRELKGNNTPDEWSIKG